MIAYMNEFAYHNVTHILIYPSQYGVVLQLVIKKQIVWARKFEIQFSMEFSHFVDLISDLNERLHKNWNFIVDAITDY